MNVCEHQMQRHVRMDDGILYINLLFDHINAHGLWERYHKKKRKEKKIGTEEKRSGLDEMQYTKTLSHIILYCALIVFPFTNFL